MARQDRHFSNRSLYSIYLLLRTLRNGADRVKLTESCIRSFLGRERLHNSAIWDLAHWFRPYFPYAEVQHKSLFLYVAKQDNADKEEEFSSDLHSLSTQVQFMRALNFNKLEKEGLISQLDKLRNQFKKLQTNYKTEIVGSMPNEIDEELIAKEVAECIFNYETIKSMISQKQA